MGSVWARLEAVPAVDALVIIEHDLGIGTDALGVLAPEAVERAALQENGRADAWTVVDGEPLDIEDDALFRFGAQVLSATIGRTEKISLHVIPE